jgi:hypothetical protein
MIEASPRPEDGPSFHACFGPRWTDREFLDAARRVAAQALAPPSIEPPGRPSPKKATILRSSPDLERLVRGGGLEPARLHEDVVGREERLRARRAQPIV